MNLKLKIAGKGPMRGFGERYRRREISVEEALVEMCLGTRVASRFATYRESEFDD